MKQFKLGLESIDFQNLALLKEIAMAVDDLRKLEKKDIPESDEARRVSKIINAHTNLNVIVNFDNQGPYVIVPQVHKNHPFINHVRRNYTTSAIGLNELAKNDGMVRGKANLRENKVYGIFAELQATIEMPLNMLKGTAYTSEEIAAVILHEVGHLFTYYEYMTRVVSGNQVLAAVSKDLDGSGSIEERENVLITLKKQQNLSDLDATRLARSTDKSVTEAVIISAITRQTTSELGRNIYDSTTWEMLADQYVARCGGARALASALSKLYGSMWHISFRSLPAFLFMEAVKILCVIVNPFITVAMCAMDGNGDNTYDRPGARITRVRSQIIEQLKDKKLSKDDIERLNADIVVIDSLLKDINDRRQFFGVVWDCLSSDSRKDRNYENLQKDLEVLASNDLFAKSAALRAINL